ncbi:helix-turn-helix domain-containing protein [Rossellomorea sp. SC111]|uniref:helix-turn-helix domain-containing protein n=1 Tax=Rossellomorea sp. SC111 TaxID=2968985 RepID=UPI00215A2754|nr:helix-turn-helix domain-containing protein [Rossellomorea sp. SC111]MCR8849768.1 helix-turn-helix domain-containing protein [Rossellomorea sp. SC111]
MIEGKLIKFHREESGLTQEQLAQGICSTTHLSKIERGITEYSSEITDLLAKRLGVDMVAERSRYESLRHTLTVWNDAIIMIRAHEIHQLKSEIEQEPLRFLSDFFVQYHLLLARYHLFLDNPSKAKEILNIFKNKQDSLSPYEHNLLQHVRGIYYYSTRKFDCCIQALKQIDDEYPNAEYYFHLATAYHSIHSNTFAYYYGQRALQFFQKSLNILRVIDSEILILIQLNAKEPFDMEQTKQQYDKLLRVCESVNSMERAHKIHNNLGFEYFRRKRYEESKESYEKALALTNGKTPASSYLVTLSGYILSCMKGCLLPKSELIQLARKGLKMAEENQDPTYAFFEIYLLTLKENEEDLYTYIEKSALPHFKSTGNQLMYQHYERQLFLYYVKSGQTEKGFQLASEKMTNEISYYELE